MSNPITSQLADLNAARNRDEGVRTYVRTVIARSLATDGREAVDIASNRWGSGAKATEILKAVVGGAGTSGALVPDELPAVTSFFRLVDQNSILGRMPVRRVPPATRLLVGGDGAAANWVAEGKAVPVSLASFTGTSLDLLKIAALSVVSRELLESVDPVAEDAVTAGLVKAVRDEQDSSFIDPAQTGVAGESPASITAGATTIASTGATAEFMRTDILNLAAGYGGDWSRACIVTHPINALALSLHQQFTLPGNVAFGDLRWIISGNCPTNIVALVDAGDIAVAAGEGRVRGSQHGTLQMDSDPTNDASTGTATTQVSMWQANAVALMAVREINWTVVRSDAVVVLSGVTWGA